VLEKSRSCADEYPGRKAFDDSFDGNAGAFVDVQEYDEIIRRLVMIAAHQDVINEKQDITSTRLATAIERLEGILVAIRDILNRGNGR
jgi:hypothetical protein